MVETLSLIPILVIQLQLQIKPLKEQVITRSQIVTKHPDSNVVYLESNREKAFMHRVKHTLLFYYLKSSNKLIHLQIN
jgi:hypothetical protein